MNDFEAWNRQVIEEFRANEGKVGGQVEGMPLLLLTTTGAKSGKQRINPLVYTTDGERLVIIASTRLQYVSRIIPPITANIIRLNDAGATSNSTGMVPCSIRWMRFFNLPKP